MKAGQIGRWLVAVVLLLAALAGATALQGTAQDVYAQDAKTTPPAAKEKPAESKKPVEPPTSVEEHPGTGRSAVPERAGGPDQFGYSYIDSNEPGGPIYNYITAANRVSDLGDEDDHVYTDTVPFPLSIYGHQSYTVTISTNGHVHFNSDFCQPGGSPPVCNWNNLSLPNPQAPAGMVAPFWDDLNLQQGGDVYTSVIGTAPSRTYVVEWRNAALHNIQNTSLNFEVLFEEATGNIIFQYGSLIGNDSSGANATVGIQNLQRTIGLQYSQNAGILSQGLAIRFYLQGGTVVSPGNQSRTTSPGNTVLFANTLRNQTGADNSYTFSLSDSNPAFRSVVTPTSTGTLTPSGSISFTVGVEVPLTVTVPSTNVTTLNITAANSGPNCPNGDCNVTVMLTTTVTTYGVDFQPGNREGVGSAGASVTYTSTLTNRTGGSTRFTLSASGNTWPAVITPTQTIQLADNGSTTVVVRVDIPPGAELGSRDTLTVTVRDSSNTFRGQLVLTTIAGNWATRGFMNLPRSRHGLADYPPNGNVYALGGESANNNRNLPIEEFDPRSGNWQRRTNLVLPVSNVGAATVGNLIYVVGGYDGNGAVDTLQTYDPRIDTATTVSSDPLPARVFGAGVAAMNGRLYVVGGSDMNAASRSLYVYDPGRPAGSRWQRLADMPTRRVWLAAAALDGKLYALGGVPSISDLTDLKTAEVYDPNTNTWATLPDMAVARGGAAAVGVPSGQACGGFIYVAGGGWFQQTAKVERYSPGTGWTQLADMQLARRNLGFAYSASRGQLVAAGGYDTNYHSYTEVLGCGGQASPPPTATPGGTISPTATPVAGCSFSDVPGSFWGYEPITQLACRGIVSGYEDGTFRPFTNMTRGQIAKVIVLAQGWELENPATPSFVDVPAGNPFYTYVETAFKHRIIQGYADGTFRWGNNVTRGQVAKMVVLAAGIEIDTTGGPHFADVPVTNPFYEFVETAYNREIISGYEDGTFRWGNYATRAQVAKVVYSTMRE